MLTADTPCEILCSTRPSLHDSPTSSVTHVTIDGDWRGAALRPHSVQTAGVVAGTEELRAACQENHHCHLHFYLMFWFAVSGGLTGVQNVLVLLQYSRVLVHRLTLLPQAA